MDPTKYMAMESKEKGQPETDEDPASPIDKLMDAMGIQDDQRDTVEAAFVAAVQAIVDGDIPTTEG